MVNISSKALKENLLTLATTYAISVCQRMIAAQRYYLYVEIYHFLCLKLLTNTVFVYIGFW